ncbi:MAG: 50S ribosomal protein L37ae [Candidatus Bathyarchaeota archaeon]
MSKSKSTKIIIRFGARYGRTVRKRVGQIESGMKKKHRCQSCGSLKVERVSVGVWKCIKCGLTFSGGAYLPSSSLGEVAKRSIRKQM